MDFSMTKKTGDILSTTPLAVAAKGRIERVQEAGKEIVLF